MKSLIILKGLVKQDKIRWVKRENLINFLIDIDRLKKIFYRPEYRGGSKDYLVRSYDDVIYKVFIQALCSRMSTGSLVVVDADNESTTSIEELAIIFGYTVFYHIEKIPSDYITRNQKYIDEQYPQDQKLNIRKIVSDFREPTSNLINSYKDLVNYWKPTMNPVKLNPESTILHLSDLHSHYNIFMNSVPRFNSFSLSILLGDYIDGPEKGGSRGLIDFILSSNYQNLLFIEGNHELRLRKYLGYSYFKAKGKKIITEILEEELSAEFMEKTASEFSDIKSSEVMLYLECLNKKLNDFIIYERDNTKFICTHCGLRWMEQLSPKYIGNVIYSNKNPNRTDQSFSEKYNGKVWSIHGHCKYPSGLEFNKYRGVINLDTEDEYKVNYLINYPNKKLEICVIDEK